MTATRVRRLKLNNAQLTRLGRFFILAGRDDHLPREAAREEWGCMDSVARSAVRRLGLVPQLTAAGCIPS